MVTQAWHGENELRDKDENSSPVVTIFGAGVAGLSLAHELVERGFAVQVVEREVDPDQPYECLVGGLAANQYARTPADAPRLHPYLYDEPTDADDVDDPYARGVVLGIQDGLDGILTLTVGTYPLTVHVDPKMNGAALLLLLMAAINNLQDLKAEPLDPTGKTNDLLIQTKSKRTVPRVAFSWVPTGSSTPQETSLLSVERTSALDALRNIGLRRAQARFAFPQRLQFERTQTTSSWTVNEDEYGAPNRQKLEQIYTHLVAAYFSHKQDLDGLIDKTKLAGRISERMRCREELLVELRGYTDGDGEIAVDRALALSWIELVKAWLVQRNDDAENGQPAEPYIPNLKMRVALVPVGASRPVGNPYSAAARARSNRVEVRIVENRIPGEHGYRFFPRFYRHLFDTMKRTPILDADGKETGDTAYDQLVDTESVDLGLRDGRNPYEVPVRRPRSLEEMRKLLRIHFDRYEKEVRGLRISARDAARFQVRLLKFLTSSSKRREKYYQDQSWWEFVGGETGGGYSPEMANLLKEMPQALLAMNAEETDARSQGVIYTQLLLDSLGDGHDCNKTLNGPTSEAWLSHWKRYLKRQGVRFFVGEVSRLFWAHEGTDPVLLPMVTQSQATSAKIAVVVTSVSSDRYALRLNSRLVEFPSSASQTQSFVSIVKGLAAAIKKVLNEQPQIGIDVDTTRAAQGVLELSNTFSASARILLVRKARNSISQHVALNGSDIKTGPIEVAGGIIAAVKEAIDRVAGSLLITRELTPAAPGSFPRREEAVLVEPKSDLAIISVLTGDPGEYGVEIDGREFRFRQDTMETPETVRNALFQIIHEQISGASTFNRTGIVIPGADLRVSVDRWRDRVALGPDLRVGDPHKNPNLEVLRADLLHVEAISGVGIEGAISEDPSVTFLSQQVTIGTKIELAPSPCGGPDFYVLALPLERASDLVWGAYSAAPQPHYDVQGCFEQLINFDAITMRRTSNQSNAESIPVVRDASGRPTPKQYPLRDLSGIQFYFDHHVRIGSGHSYFPHAAFGLSSISQLAHWRERMSEKSAFLGQLSVDIGSWYAPVRAFHDPKGTVDEQTPPLQPSAWCSTRDAIAYHVWKQIKEGVNAAKAAKIVDPRYYHLDQGIQFEDPDGMEFAGGVQIVLSTKPIALSVAGVPITLSTPTGALLVTEIERVPGLIALALSATAVWVAPAAMNQKSVRVYLTPGDDDTAYRVRVGDKDVLVVSTSIAHLTTVEIRSQLVERINTNIPGAIASSNASEAGDTAFSLRITLAAADRTISVLAFEPTTKLTKNFIVLDPGGSVRVKAGPNSGVTIDGEGCATPIRNATMFLINGPGAWASRPGLYVDKWQSSALPFPDEADEPGDEPPRPDVIYHPTNKRWLMVGNLMATHTRLSTMESANESARHAVIAMLRAVSADVDVDELPDYNGQGHLLADFPKLWDPEKNELDDTEPLKRLDAQLCDAEVDHFLDILNIPQWIDGLPEDFDLTTLPKELSTLVDQGIKTVEKDWGFTPLEEFGKAAREAVQKLIGLGS